MSDEVSPQQLAQSLSELKKKTSWSWETMSREFQQVMGERGPSSTTLFRYAKGKVKRRNLVVERYVRSAVEKSGCLSGLTPTPTVRDPKTAAPR